MTKPYLTLVWALLLFSPFQILAFSSPVFTSGLRADKDHICPGGSVKLSATVSGANLYRFQQKEENSDWNDVPGASGNPAATSGMISLDLYDIQSSSLYRVIISDTVSGEDKYSEEIHVYPRQTTFSIQPLSQVQCNGLGVEFRTAVVASTAIRYQWQISTDGGGNFSDLSPGAKITGTVSETLKITGLVNSDHGGVFRCKVTDNGNCVSYSASASLSVNQLSTAIQPTLSTRFCEGEKAEFFPAAVVGEPTSYQWQIKTATSPGYVSLEESTRFSGVLSEKLTVNGIGLQETAFQIRVSFKNKLQGNSGEIMEGTCLKTASRSGYTIYPRPQAPADFSGPERCGPGKISLTLTSASGSFSWYADTLDNALLSGTNTFTSPFLSNTDTFFVSFTDSRGCESFRKPFEVLVHPKPYARIPELTDICRQEQYLSLQVDSVAGNPLFYSISPSSGGMPGFQNTSDQSFDLLHISLRFPSDKSPGTYTFYTQLKDPATSCLSDSLSFSIRVKEKVSITQQPVSVARCEKTEGGLHAAAASEDSLRYQWFKNGLFLSGQNHSYLRIPSLTQADDGVYKCLIISGCDSIFTDEARITVLPQTNIIRHPLSGELCSGRQAFFSVTASGSGTLHYQWFVDGTAYDGDSSVFRPLFTSDQKRLHKIWCRISSDCGAIVISDTATLALYPLPSPPVITRKTGYCQGETITVPSPGLASGHTARWYSASMEVLPAAPVLAPSSTGNFRFYISQIDSSGCESPPDTVEIIVSPAFINTLDASLPAVCITGNLNREVTLTSALGTASGRDFNYTWFRNDSLLTGKDRSELTVSQEGIYGLKVVSGYCTSYTTLNVPGIFSELHYLPEAEDKTVCKNGRAVLEASGPFSGGHFRWWASDTILTHLSAMNPLMTGSLSENTSYFVSYLKEKEGVNCESPRKKVSVRISMTADFEMSVTPVSCDGRQKGSIEVTGLPEASGYRFFLDDILMQASPLFLNLDDRQYKITVVDSLGCENEKYILVSRESEIKILLQPESVTRCQGNTVNFTLKADHYQSIQWQRQLPGGFFADIMGETGETLKITNAGNTLNPHLTRYRAVVSRGLCTEISKEATLFVNGKSGNLDSKEVCSGTGVTWVCPSVTGQIHAFQWQRRNGSSGSFTDIAGAQSDSLVLISVTKDDHNAYFRCRITFINPDQTTCNVLTDDARLTVLKPELVITPAPVSCYNSRDGKISLAATGGKAPYSFRINGMNWQSHPTFSGLNGGTYQVECKDAAGCSSTEKVSIETPPDFDFSVEKFPASCGETPDGRAGILLTDTTGFTFAWSNGDTSREINGLKAGTYWVKVSHPNGCAKSDTFSISGAGSASPLIELTDRPGCPDQPFTIRALGCEGIIQWSTGQEGPVLHLYTDSTVTVRATCVVENCPSPGSNEIVITPLERLRGGEINYLASPQCAGFNPPEITNKTSPSGKGKLIIQWESGRQCQQVSTDWQEIAVANSLTYNPPVLTESTCFRRKVTDSCQNTTYSNIIVIPLSQDPQITIAASSGQLCPGDTVILQSSVTGGTGNCLLQWQKNERSGSESSSYWENIAGSDTLLVLTGISNPGPADKTIYFRSIYSCSPTSCNKTTSASRGIIIKPTVPFVSAFSDTTVCSGTALIISTTGCSGTVSWTSGVTGAEIRIIPEVAETKYTATCENECSTVSREIIVRTRPGIPAPEPTTPVSVILPQVLSFSASGENLRWYNASAAGTALQSAPVHDQPGVYMYWVSQFKNGCESPRTRISATVYPALSVQEQASDRTTCAGNMATFQVYASGAGQLRYQWQRKRPGETVFSVPSDSVTSFRATGPLLKIYNTGNAENPHLSEYRCVIRDSVSSVVSATVTLFVNSLKGSLPNYKICTGSPFSINLLNNFIVTGSAKSYQWQYRYESSGPWTNMKDSAGVSGTGTTVLVFEKMYPGMPSRYRCVVTFDNMGTECIENTDQTTITIGEIPPIPEKHFFTFCQFEKISKLDLIIPKEYTAIWFADRTQEDGWNKMPGISTDKAGDQLWYFAFRNSTGCTGPRAEVTVRVHPRPAVPVNTTPAFVFEGQTLTFSAEGTGLKWFTSRTGRNFQETAPEYFQVKSYRHFVSQTSEHLCESERTEIVAEIRASLGFTSHPQSQADCDGNSVTFSVRVKGEETPSYQWQKKRPEDTGFSNIPSASLRELKISNAGDTENPHLTLYRCVIKDSRAEVISDEAVLTVNRILGRMSHLEVCEGLFPGIKPDVLPLTGEVTTVEWQKRTGSSYKTVFQTDSLDSEFKLMQEDGGNYQIKIHFRTLGKSTCSRNTNVFTLKANPSPPAPDLSRLEVCQYQSLLSAVATPSLQWYLSDNSASALSENDLKNFSYRSGSDTLYVSVRNQWACESPRTALTLTVRSAPAQPVISDLQYCRFSTVSDTPFWWYKSEFPGQAPKPAPETSEEGVLSYQVVRRDSAGCESLKKEVHVTTSACYLEQSDLACGQLNLKTVKTNEWTYFVTGEARIVAAIHPAGHDLGDITLRYSLLPEGEIYQTPAGTRYFPRYFHLSAAGKDIFPENVKFRGFISDAELQQYSSLASDMMPADSLFSVVSYHGRNEDCDPGNNDNFNDGESRVLPAMTLLKLVSQDFYAFEFSPGYSGEFGITGNRFSEASLEGEPRGNGSNRLYWSKNKDRNALSYTLFKSSGTDWFRLADIPSPGFEFTDHLPYPGENKYNLLFQDTDGTLKILNEVILRSVESLPSCRIFPNPAGSSPTINLYAPGLEVSTFVLTDLSGKEMTADRFSMEGNHLEIAIPAKLASGAYFLTAADSKGRKCSVKFVR